jgi:hypothetical protein
VEKKGFKLGQKGRVGECNDCGMISRITSGGDVSRRRVEVWGKFVPELRSRNMK